jgi:hypothetical protein
VAFKKTELAPDGVPELVGVFPRGKSAAGVFGGHGNAGFSEKVVELLMITVAPFPVQENLFGAGKRFRVAVPEDLADLKPDPVFFPMETAESRGQGPPEPTDPLLAMHAQGLPCGEVAAE